MADEEKAKSQSTNPHDAHLEKAIREVVDAGIEAASPALKARNDLRARRALARLDGKTAVEKEVDRSLTSERLDPVAAAGHAMKKARLFNYLEDTARYDTDLSWSWKNNQSSIPAIGAIQVDEFVNKLPPAERKKVKYISVDNWYSKDQIRERSRRKMLDQALVVESPTETGQRLSEDYKILKHGPVLKIFSTNATHSYRAIKQPSLFISSDKPEERINPGDVFILVDDTIDSGGTARDLVRHINNRGGRVLGLVASHRADLFSNYFLWDQSSNERCKKELFALAGKMPETSAATPEQESQGHLESVPNHSLSRVGLTLDQLTVSELDDLTHRAQEYVRTHRGQCSWQGFWEEQTKGLVPLLPMDRKSVANPERLADVLGIERSQVQWTSKMTPAPAASDSPSRFS